MLSKKKFVSILVLIMLLVISPPQAYAATVTISGVVKDSYTGKGVAGATVGLYPPSSGGGGGFFIIVLPIKLTTTGSTGLFSMTVDIEFNTQYSLVATKTEYEGNTVYFTMPLSKMPYVPPQTITITPLNLPPTAEANGPYPGNVGATISFSSAGSNDPDGTISSYLWTFGDGTQSTNPNPTHVYTVQGIYQATLTVTDNGGKTDTDTAIATIVSPKAPIAEANGPYTAQVNQPVSFNSTGSNDPDGTIVEYRWSFGDGSPVSLTQSPSHTYTVVGNFTASLTVKDDDDLTHTDTALVVITPEPVDPIAEANGPYSGETDQEIVFDSTGSNDPDGTIIEYSWDFGDGTPAVYDWNATHIYIEADTYTVTLTVTDNSGATDTDTATCTVELPPNVPPTAVISAPPEGTAEEELPFSSSGTNDTDGEVVDYTWDFGDGSPVSHEPNPTHTYASAGTFTVTLTVTDDRGGTQTETMSVVVEPKPGLPLALILGALVIVGAAAGYYFLVLKKKEEKGPTPTSLRVTSDPAGVPADGRSTAKITVTILDEAGNPVEATKLTAVALQATIGAVSSSITIAEGASEGVARFTAGFELGSSTVSAEAEGLRPGRASVSLVEKKRYCMHCGAQMSIHDNTCPKCGKMPPSGVDVKECKNCGDVIPIVAKFCGECGASQPTLEADEPDEDA